LKTETDHRPQPSDFTFEIGRADGGRSFIRVTHVPTGVHRIQVGLTGVNQHALKQQMYQEILAELAQHHKDSCP
jgi:hypothetical protein